MSIQPLLLDLGLLLLGSLDVLFPPLSEMLLDFSLELLEEFGVVDVLGDKVAVF